MEENNDILKAILMIATFAILTCLIIGLSSCRCQPEVVTEYVRHDSIVTKEVRDSIYLHDSIFTKEYVNGDTVFREKTKIITKYKEHTLHDTITNTIVDSTKQVVKVNELTKAQKNMIKGFWIILIIAAIALGLALWKNWKQIAGWFIKILARLK